MGSSKCSIGFAPFLSPMSLLISSPLHYSQFFSIPRSHMSSAREKKVGLHLQKGFFQPCSKRNKDFDRITTMTGWNLYIQRLYVSVGFSKPWLQNIQGSHKRRWKGNAGGKGESTSLTCPSTTALEKSFGGVHGHLIGGRMNGKGRGRFREEKFPSLIWKTPNSDP